MTRISVASRPHSVALLSSDSYIKYDRVARDSPPLHAIHSAHAKRDISRYFLQVSQTWDKANKASRERILEEFIANNQNKTGPQLELELANGASLFLTRISAWLRLTYLLGNNISLQLRAISVFVCASGGHRFLAEFLEVGGVLTILEMLGLTQIRDDDKVECLRLLFNISHSGRTFKEFICESYGVRSICDCLSRTRSVAVADHCKNLMHQVGTDNPKFLTQIYKAVFSMIIGGISPLSQRIAAQTLRLILPSIISVHKTVVDAALALLKSPIIQTQFEGYELLKELSKRSQVQDIVLSSLIAILKIPGENEDTFCEDSKSLKVSVKGGALKNHGDLEEVSEESETFLRLYIQQTYAAKLIGVLAATDHSIGQRCLALNIIPALLNAVANIAYPECQKYASNTLQFFTENYESLVIQEYMGQAFAAVFKEKPDTFYKDLTLDQILFLRNATNIVANQNSHSKSFLSLVVSEKEDSDDEKDIQKATLVIETSDIAADATYPLNLADRDKEQVAHFEPVDTQKTDNAMITTMYQPFNIQRGNGIFAGSKYALECDIGIDKFALELEKLKAQKKESKDSSQEEIVLSKETTAHMKLMAKDKRIFKHQAAEFGPVSGFIKKSIELFQLEAALDPVRGTALSRKSSFAVPVPVIPSNTFQNARE